MESLLNAFRSLGPARIIALFLGLSATIVISGMVISRLNAPGLALLYGGLSQQEAGSITQYLGSQNISFETRGEGAVYVPADQVGTLRLQVAGQGLVGGSSAGYELFDSASTFGTTNFVQNLNAKRALEGELARTIGTIPAITGARVHIVMPKQTLFSSQQVAASAAVALNVGNRKLDDAQINSIAQLVAAGVPNLTPATVTIIDQRGTLLFDGRTQTQGTAKAMGVKTDMENKLRLAISTLLEKAVGAGKVAVEVTADVNTDIVQESSEIFDPAQQVVRSEQTTESASNSSTGGAGGLTGVQGNTPDGAGGDAGAGSGSNETKTETTTNYEVGKTVRQLTRNGGEVKKLSVAVMVEGKTAENANGENVYTPYTEQQLLQFKQLVQTAIGFNETRGDLVTVVDMPFTPPPEPPAIEEAFMSKDQMILYGQYAMLIIALLIVGLMVVKPTIDLLIGALSTPSAPPPLLAMNAANFGPNGGGAPAIEESAVDIRSVQGRVRESSIKKVNEIIDQHPEESLNMVRSWMSQNDRPSGDDA